MRRDRRLFDASFKAKVALEALREQKTINQLAAEYDLHPQPDQPMEKTTDGQLAHGV